MARYTAILGVLFGWMLLLTFLPLYLLLTGQYSVVRSSVTFEGDAGGGLDHEAVRVGGGPPRLDHELEEDELPLRHFKRGVRAAVAEDDRDTVDIIPRGLKRTHRDDEASELSLTGLYPAVDAVGSPAIRTEIRRALTKSEHSGANSRAAFELVVALSSLLPKISNISRVKTPTPEAFRNYIAPMGLPVILTGMFEDQMLGQWTWDYVRSKWGDTVFHNTRQGNYSTKTSKAGKYFVNRVSVKLADFIDVVTGKREPSKNERGMYITKQKVIPDEALEAEFYYPPFYTGAHKNCFLEPTGWIGSPGTLTQGHIDSKDNFIYQIIGKKRWRLFSPQDYKYLYYTQTKGTLEWSEVLTSFDKEVDLQKYPLYAKATPITLTMEPGEVLYLPRGWTHMVENVTPALMINVWRYGPAAITEHWSEKKKREIYKRCMMTL